MRFDRKQGGVTLVELVVTIGVIAAAGVTLVGTLSYTSGAGSDHILQAQAQSIADSYVSNIAQQPFANVAAYNGLDQYATDHLGNSAGNFRVRVALTPGTLGALPANQVWRIDVTVDYGSASQVIATGYRTNHP